MFIYLYFSFPTDTFLFPPVSSILNIRHSKASTLIPIFLLPTSLDTVGAIKIYGSEGEKGGDGGRRSEQRGNSLAEEQKAKLMITRDLEMGMTRTETSSPHSFNLHSIPDLPLFLFKFSCLFSVLSFTRSFSALLRQVLVVFHVQLTAGND